MRAILQKTIHSPVGQILLVQDNECLTRIRWSETAFADHSPLLAAAGSQLDAYFAGTLRSFDLPLAWSCSAFQAEACRVMSEIPYGGTMTYAEMARQMGTSPQAAGMACGGNPFPIVVPCHRVLASRGIGGYSGGEGIETKITLLKLESAVPWLI